MKKFLIKCGYTVYQSTPDECAAVTVGIGVCDFCTNLPKQTDPMYIIPVLNGTMCKDCFEDWKQRAVFYDEDLEFEKHFIKLFEQLLIKQNIKLEDLTNVNE